MNGKHLQKKIEWTAEDRERRRQVRERFKDKPTLEQLIASGELSGETVPMGLYMEILQLLHDLKKAREAAGLSLTHLAERTGMDQAVLSKMENGRHGIPTVPALARYAQAPWAAADLLTGSGYRRHVCNVSHGGQERHHPLRVRTNRRFAQVAGTTTACPAGRRTAAGGRESNPM